MIIYIRKNAMFGGYRGYIANNNLTIAENKILNVSATRYTNKDKNKIIEQCKKEYLFFFGNNLKKLKTVDDDNLI